MNNKLEFGIKNVYMKQFCVSMQYLEIIFTQLLDHTRLLPKNTWYCVFKELGTKLFVSLLVQFGSTKPGFESKTWEKAEERKGCC